MDIPAALIAVFPPSPDALLNKARRQMDDAMLMSIASADYGYMAGEMLAMLRPIRETGIIPTPMHGQLAEVLELSRWLDPAVPNPPPFRPGPQGRSAHQIRFFACAVLLRAEVESPGQFNASEDSTLAQCVVSAKVLGEEMSEAAARFLTWRIPRVDACSEPALLALALLILAMRLRSGRIADPVLNEVAEWVLAQESANQKAFPSNAAEPRPYTFSIQIGLWQPLADELRDAAAAVASDDVSTNLQLCALLLR
jgi:hypothetical protein